MIADANSVTQHFKTMALSPLPSSAQNAASTDFQCAQAYLTSTSGAPALLLQDYVSSLAACHECVPWSRIVLDCIAHRMAIPSGALDCLLVRFAPPSSLVPRFCTPMKRRVSSDDVFHTPKVGRFEEAASSRAPSSLRPVRASSQATPSALRVIHPPTPQRSELNQSFTQSHLADSVTREREEQKRFETQLLELVSSAGNTSTSMHVGISC